MVVPRKGLFCNPDGYSYKRPSEIKDGLKTGLLEDELKIPDLLSIWSEKPLWKKHSTE